MEIKKNKQPMVSVCVPIYNVEQYIGKCVESLMQQTYHNIEFIFVNDCTPDNSMEVLQEVLDHYPQRMNQVTIINFPQNKGVLFSRNHAIKVASGDYIFYVDSDDWIEKNAIEVLIAKQQESNADLVFGNYMVHLPNGEIKVAKHNIFSNNNPLEYILKNIHNYHLWGNLILKDLYTNNIIQCKLGNNVGEDLQVFPQLCYYAGHSVSLDQPIYHYNKCNALSTGKGKKDLNWFKQLVESFNIFYDFFENLEIMSYTNLLRQSKNDFLFRNMRVSVMEESKDAYQLLKTELHEHEVVHPQYKYQDVRHILKKNYTIYRLHLLLTYYRSTLNHYFVHSLKKRHLTLRLFN